MKTYQGDRTRSGCRVLVFDTAHRNPNHARELNLRLDLRNHSPTGFEWGYLGSGPAQLALALLADATDNHTALAFYQRYKEEVIARLPSDIQAAWTTTDVDVVAWVERQERRTA